MSKLRWFLYFLVSAITLLLKPIVKLVFFLIYGNGGRSISCVTEPLLLQSATKLAAMIRAKEVSAVEVLQAFIKRAEEVNPMVNAIVAERYAQALEEARQVDQILAQDPLPPEFSPECKPFLGVPLTVKECFALKDMPQTSGLVSRKGVRAQNDAPTVKRLRDAGMIPFASTNTSELCMWFESSNNLYGTTNNAYDLTRMVGGSSGGEGCIVSCGASVVGVGSDIGGSIRMPAFFNGVFGHKPSPDLVSSVGQHPPATGGQIDLLATGPVCRYAEDLLPILKVMAGPQAQKLQLDTQVSVNELRVFSAEDDGGGLLVASVDPQLKEVQRRALNYLHIAGARTETMQFPLMRYSAEMWSAKMAAGKGTKFACFMAQGEESGQKVNCFAETLRWIVGGSPHTLPAIGLGLLEALTPASDPNIPALLHLLDVLRRDLCALLGEDGVLLYPSHPTPAPQHHRAILTPFNFAYTAVFNALALPVTQVPLGLGREGVPLGVQVVAGPYMDHLTMAVARQLERDMGGWVSPGARS